MKSILNCLDTGTVVASETEEEIFRILGTLLVLFFTFMYPLLSCVHSAYSTSFAHHITLVVGTLFIITLDTDVPWQEPHERVRG